MKFKYSIAFCLVSAVILTMPLGVLGAPDATPDDGGKPAFAQNAGTKTKDEVIYASMKNDGGVRSIYAVNQFEVARAGSIVDYGEYNSVENLTDTQPIDMEGDRVSFSAEAGNFYYQGNMTATNLPWDFDVSYYLNEQKTAANDLAGKNGELEIKMRSAKNGKIDPTFYDNYMLQITVSLDTGKCSGIDAPDAAIADAGQNKAIVYTVLPGKDADYSLRANVNDFTMAGIEISAVPFSMGFAFSDTNVQFEDLQNLPGAVSELNEGAGALAGGAQGLKDGAYELTKGSASIQSGLNQLSGNSGQLLGASAQIRDALTAISDLLGSGSLDEIDLSQLAQLPPALSQLSGGLNGVSGGLTELKNGFVPAYAALDSAIAAIPDGTVTPEQIGAMYGQVDPSLQGALGELSDTYAAAQTVKGTYASVKAAFDAVGGTIDTLNASIGGIAVTLSDMSAQLDGMLQGTEGPEDLGDLVLGLSQLASSYNDFHSGLTGYMNGVHKLASKYGAFHTGVASFESGVGQFADGIGKLHEGTSEFNDEAADIPDQIQTEIDKMKDEYLPADFDPVSFTSSKNTDTGYVQFVMKTEGIEKPDKDKEEEKTAQTTGQETFWDRLAALFKN
jgi:X-X-X-Leu-X-X-Gly heptad repeat protein